MLLLAVSAALLIRTTPSGGNASPRPIASSTTPLIDEDLALLVSSDAWDASLTELTSTAARLDESIAAGTDWSENSL
jgi:hypothetical protein